MSEESKDSVSESKHSKTAVPPGWNDPPLVQYDKKNPPPKSRITNKRVAFPLDQPVTGTTPCPISKPPTSNSHEPPPKNPPKDADG